MLELDSRQFGGLLQFVPDVPEATVPIHCLRTGQGSVFVDDMSSPRCIAVTVESRAGADHEDVFLYGPSAAPELIGFIEGLSEPSEVHGDEQIGEMVKQAHEDVEPRRTVVFSFDRLVELDAGGTSADLRRLTADDVADVGNLVPTWAWGVAGGPKDVLGKGGAFGKFEDDGLASVAFVTDTTVRYETLSAMTRSESRRRGAAEDCCRLLLGAIFDRGSLPRCEMGERNEAGIGLAEKIGFPCRTNVTSYFVDVF